MSFFRYEALDRAGKLVMGTMDAPSESAVNARLMQMGYRPHRVAPAGNSGVAVITPNSKPSVNGTAAVRTPKSGTTPAVSGAAFQTPEARMKGAKPKDLALFFRQWAALIRSGISLYESMEHLAPRTAHPTLKRTAQEMATAARNGERVSDVMIKYPRLYAPHVVASVQGGELGGFLDIVLDEIAYDYEQDVAFYKGMWLPRTLVIQQLFAVAIAQPLFPNLFPNGDYAAYARLVLLRNLPIAFAILLFVRWLVFWLALPQNRATRDRLALKVPVFGDLARQKSLASFVRMLRRLFAAGVGPIGAWEGAMNVASNSVIRAKLVEANRHIQQNVPLHDAFTMTGLFANETEQLLATGMVSGQVVEMLERVAEYYQDNVDRAFRNAQFWMKRLTITLFIVLIGAVAIIMTKSYFTSIFKFADDFAKDAGG